MATEVYFELHLCRSTDSIPKEKVLRLPAFPETVNELKEAIEAQHNIPQCLQTLTIGDGDEVDDDNLASLVSGDTIKVAYLSEAPVKTLKQLTDCIKRVEECARSQKQIDKETMSECNKLLHATRDRTLVPWLSDRTTASRMHLVQLGAIDVIVSLLELLQTNIQSWARWDQLPNLEEMLLAWLQNFAETTESQEPVVRRGGFQLMLNALMRVDITRLGSDTAEFNMFRIAIGCVSNYCETRSCRLELGANTEAVQRILEFALVAPSDAYSRVLIANCTFRLSCSQETHLHLSSDAIFSRVLKFAENSLKTCAEQGKESDYILITYSVLLAIGRIIILMPQTNVVMSPGHIKQGIDLIQTFLASADRTSMKEVGKLYDRNWNSLDPFIEPICQQQEGSESHSNTIKKLFFFSLTLELPRKRILRMARKESMREQLTSLRSYAPDEEDRASYDECLSLVFSDEPTPASQNAEARD